MLAMRGTIGGTAVERRDSSRRRRRVGGVEGAGAPAQPQAAKGFKGTIVKRSGDKTAKVRVSSFVEHPLYKKRILRNTTLLCHDEENTGRVGDYVLIRQARPHSRKKHFEIYNTLEKARLDTSFADNQSPSDEDQELAQQTIE